MWGLAPASEIQAALVSRGNKKKSASSLKREET